MQGEIVLWRITFLFAAFLVLLFRTRLVTAEASNSLPWLILRGYAPSVVAKGGFSGFFPDSSEYAYKFTALTGSPDTISWCDVQLTKDGIGLCLPNIELYNCTDISQYFPDWKKSYVINEVFPVAVDLMGEVVYLTYISYAIGLS